MSHLHPPEHEDNEASELRARIEALEIRSTHQEAALDELTRTLLEQERLIREQADMLRRLEVQLRDATPAPVAGRDEEVPPPHY
jgi:SlyX protein